MKRKRPTKDMIREAMRGLPPILHAGTENIPPMILPEFGRAFRETVLDRSTLTKQQWKHARWRGNGPLRTDAIETLIYATFCRFDSQILLDHFPPCESHCVIDRRGIVTVCWNRLASTEVRGKLLYHWPERPTVGINRGQYVAGFTLHALLRLAERFNMTVGASRVMAASFLRCSAIEADGNRGFYLWTKCNTQLLANAANVLTNTTDPMACEFRVGYCPVRFVGRFAAVKTVLHPAMRVAGINENLVSFDKLATYKRRFWEELCLLNQKLLMVRESTASATKRKPFRLHSDSPFRQTITLTGVVS